MENPRKIVGESFVKLEPINIAGEYIFLSTVFTFLMHENYTTWKFGGPKFFFAAFKFQGLLKMASHLIDVSFYLSIK